jgi:organic hydroperoxide reductase OsmC/OhrA
MPQRQALVQKAHQVRPCSDATRNDIGAKPTLA